MKHRLLCVIFTFIIPLFGCQTIHKNQEEQSKEQAILASQKSLIVNFLNKGVPNMALKELRRLLTLHPKDPDFLNLMGLTQLALENPNQAIKYFRRAYTVHPRTSVALNLSSAYIEAGRFAKAIQVLKKVKDDPVSQNYQHPERIFHNIALAAERNQNNRMAEKYYIVALSENPNYYLSLMRLGQLYERTKRPVDAQKTFSKAKSACPKCFDPVNALAMGFVASGKHKSAYIILRRYLNKKEIPDDGRQKAEKLITMVKKIARSRAKRDMANARARKNRAENNGKQKSSPKSF
ncbi:tetratricopeptide repeat protein [Pseudobacteriovorax antillogorgiicola]|uniref:Tfp pilus assembly protein PilF n=1 Tax=Pseudobacteriovorax antillogorgiicola TaxID=1513793 RepID=A0A1Y6C644_9BACT|nr:tetratricopeptide repeat protein [Pseudobacteriovorax antillogorgiicola]TCS49486.1 Tfp pilus assembly protein PilF [Pseudobacteriovorax antillogorgiicola]SMF46059.1 Tfp pilus assembly protein PilF [Pseudobacteriovorax antillogorgiicola]